MQNPSVSLEAIQACIDEIRSWMFDNKLVLNDSKTEITHFTSRFGNTESIESVRVGDDPSFKLRSKPRRSV